MPLQYTKDIWPQYPIGDHTYGPLRIIGKGSLSIGKFCSIASGVTIWLGVEHNTHLGTTYPFSAKELVGRWPTAKGYGPQPFAKGPVIIENDVWIGANVTILSGITVCNGAVIGTGSVVTKSIGPYEVWAGNPAQLKYRRFDLQTIAKLQKLKWWDWPDEKIAEYLPVLCSEDISWIWNLTRKED
jgi:acetyltransferase-like isoleucine patch superfamily enzyme